jgi:hypothetical protein
MVQVFSNGGDMGVKREFKLIEEATLTKAQLKAKVTFDGFSNGKHDCEELSKAGQIKAAQIYQKEEDFDFDITLSNKKKYQVKATKFKYVFYKEIIEDFIEYEHKCFYPIAYDVESINFKLKPTQINDKIENTTRYGWWSGFANAQGQLPSIDTKHSKYANFMYVFGKSISSNSYYSLYPADLGLEIVALETYGDAQEIRNKLETQYDADHINVKKENLDAIHDKIGSITVTFEDKLCVNNNDKDIPMVAQFSYLDKHAIVHLKGYAYYTNDNSQHISSCTFTKVGAEIEAGRNVGAVLSFDFDNEAQVYALEIEADSLEIKKL